MNHISMAQGIQKMEPVEFLRQLPEVQDLTNNDECPVCLQKYVPTNAPGPGIIERLISIAVRQGSESIKPEHAVRLPCQHVLGSDCIRRWVSSAEGSHTTCPYCVQQLFRPASCQFDSDPLGDALFAIMGEYGFIMDPHGCWLWNETKGRVMLSAQDVVDSVEHAGKYRRMLGRYFGPVDRKTFVRRMAASRVTSHLRQTLLYLDLLDRGARLPKIGQISLQYPFVTLGEHHLNALFDELTRRKLLLRHIDRRTWEKMRLLGIVDPVKWGNDKSSCGFA